MSKYLPGYPSTDIGVDETTAALHRFGGKIDFTPYIYLFLVVIVITSLISTGVGVYFIYTCIKDYSYAS